MILFCLFGVSSEYYFAEPEPSDRFTVRTKTSAQANTSREDVLQTLNNLPQEEFRAQRRWNSQRAQRQAYWDCACDQEVEDILSGKILRHEEASNSVPHQNLITLHPDKVHEFLGEDSQVLELGKIEKTLFDKIVDDRLIDPYEYTDNIEGENYKVFHDGSSLIAELVFQGN